MKIKGHHFLSLCYVLSIIFPILAYGKNPCMDAPDKPIESNEKSADFRIQGDEIAPGGERIFLSIRKVNSDTPELRPELERDYTFDIADGKMVNLVCAKENWDAPIAPSVGNNSYFSFVLADNHYNTLYSFSMTGNDPIKKFREIPSLKMAQGYHLLIKHKEAPTKLVEFGYFFPPAATPGSQGLSPFRTRFYDMNENGLGFVIGRLDMVGL